jgi:hypothetical protein
MVHRQDTYFHRVLVPLANIARIAEDFKNVPIAKIRIHPAGWPENWGSNFVGAGWIYIQEYLKPPFHRWMYRQEQSI